MSTVADLGRIASMLAWLAPIALPLVAAVLATLVGRWRPWLLVVAPLPALVLALAGPPGAAPDLPWLLLDVRLDLDPVARALLTTTGLVWLAGGVAARGLAVERAGTTASWLVTLAGSVGVVLAADVVTLYGSYGVMTFAAYALIVHEGTRDTLRAGRVYVVLAVVGEVLLLSGLVLAAGAAGDTGLDRVTAALTDAPGREAIIGLIAAGFAVKAGIVPLHVWLPLAHPAAPVAASAVLSGAMIKAGLVGWLAVLPIGAIGLPGAGGTLVGVGLSSAVVGAALGVVQPQPKAVLAYSSVSQMGLIAAIVGVGLAGQVAGRLAVAGAAVYALHHGLAKAALFLAVGVQETAFGRRRPRWVLAGVVLAALALAGVPLTSGWVAKLLAKDAIAALAGPWAGRIELLFSAAAIGTTLLMLRLLHLLRRTSAGPVTRPGAAGDAMAGAWLALLGLVAGATWLVPARLLGPVQAPRPDGSSVVDGLWPVAVGVLVAVVAARWWPARGHAERPLVPAGDLVVLAEAGQPLASRLAVGTLAAAAGIRGRASSVAAVSQRLARPEWGFASLDGWLTRWRVTGAVFALLGVALLLAMGLVP